MRINKITVGAILLAVIIAGIVWFVVLRGTLQVTIASDSVVKTNIHFWLSSDNYKNPHLVPSKVRLQPGDYTLTASGTNSAIIKQDFKITTGKTTTISLKLIKNPENSLIGTTDNQKLPPYATLFPKNGGDYLITATLNTDNTVISALVITVYHQIPSDQPTFYSQERDQIVQAAKRWLAANNVPSTIPITITDQ